jgi:predicted O-methyltransferase YrrM
MSFKDRLRWQLRGGVAVGAAQWETSTRDSRAVELVLTSLLSSPDFLSSLHFPVQFVEFVRGCIEDRCPHNVRELKTESEPQDSASKRFAVLKGALVNSLPPIEFSVSRDLALIADRNRCLSEAIEIHNWAGDLGLHFSLSSSLGSKGRILFNIIRIMRCEHCLELGTAYGMSSLFILSALQRYVPSGSLATLEGFDKLVPIHSIVLKQHYGEMVSCHFGNAGTILPDLVKSLGHLNFLFHDCGHSRADYINDFTNVVDALAPGAVVLFDDIRWEDTRFNGGILDTYSGWTTVVSHPRVREAVEIDDSLGMLLLK